MHSTRQMGLGIVLLAVAVKVTTAQDTYLPPDDPNIQYMGRWAFPDEGERGAVAVNPGSVFRLNIQTPAEGVVDARLLFHEGVYADEPPHLWIRMDDQPWRELPVQLEIPLFTEKPQAGLHRVEVVFKGADEWKTRWESPLEAAIVLTGVKLSGGASLVPPPPLPALKMEFFGDSITEGIRAMGMGERDRWPFLTDSRRTWAFLTGQGMNANFRICGFGRHGVAVPGNGGIPPAAKSFRFIFDEEPTDAFRPHITVINLGHNDSLVKPEEFQKAYAEYLNVVRKVYSDTLILCVQPFAGMYGAQIKQIVEQRIASGDTRIRYVDTTGWLDKKCTADGAHPTLEGHKMIADRLLPIVKGLATEYKLPPESGGR